MYKQILVPIDLGDPELAKRAIATAVMMAGLSGGAVRLVNVLPLTPVMLAEYVPPDFEVQQRKSAEEALVIVAMESGLDAARVSSSVRHRTRASPRDRTHRKASEPGSGPRPRLSVVRATAQKTADAAFWLPRTPEKC